MLSTVLEDVSPYWDPEGPGISDVKGSAKAAVYAAGIARASAYSVERGLVMPMRSTTYRRYLGQALGASETAGKFFEYVAPLAIGAHALFDAGNGAITGACH